MNIDWTVFTPKAALLGGLLIGLATALYLWGNGRVAGISSILANPWQALRTRAALTPHRTSLFFLAGLLAAPWLWSAVAPLPPSQNDVGWPGLIGAGFLVGVGVRMANGCTSGHGVCGLSRFSVRSLVNVMTFMGAGMATVFVLRHLM